MRPAIYWLLAAVLAIAFVVSALMRDTGKQSRIVE